MTYLTGSTWTINPSRGAQVSCVFSSDGCDVTLTIQGSPKPPVKGLFAEDGNGNFVIQGPSGYGWWNMVFAGSCSSPTAGTGNYMSYESPPRAVSFLTPFKINKA